MQINRTKCNKQCEGLAFLGEPAHMFARFTAAACADGRSILIYDASFTKRLFIDAIGTIDDTLVYYHGAHYTTDLSYVLRAFRSYDLLIIFDDFVTETNFRVYGQLVKHIYACVQAERYCLVQAEKMADSLKNLPKGECTYVYVGTEKEAKETGAVVSINMFQRDQKKRDDIYISITEEDKKEFYLLEYGSFDFTKLSDDLKQLLETIRCQIAGGKAAGRINAYRVYGV